MKRARKIPKGNKFGSGIYSIPAERYHAADGVSASMLNILAEGTPAHLKEYQANGDKPTPAKVFGVIQHRATLEPDTYKGAFHIKPLDMRFTTKDGQQWLAEHQDKPILSAEEAVQIDRMVSAIHTHPFAKRLLEGCLPEQSIFVQDTHGTLRKSRLDALTKGNVIPDIKTTTSAAIGAFERSISRYRYHVRAAYYMDNCNILGIEKTAFFFICVEKDPPYLVRCLRLMGEVLNIGRELYQHDLQIYRNCVESGKWPGWEPEWEDVGLPAYEMKQVIDRAVL